MSAPNNNSQQQVKEFLRRAAPLIRGCNDALVKRDLVGLQHYTQEFQLAARVAGQVMLEVQAQLLTQAAQQKEMYQVSYLLTRISKTLSAMLSEARTANKPATATSALASVTAAGYANNDSASKKLGNYLIEAELLTPAQIEVALADQRVTGARLGEILATRGWIKQGTIEYIMKKIIMPERKHTAVPVPAVPVAQPAEVPQSIDQRATLVDAHNSTYL
jgi:hypothetical protein